MQPVEGAVIAAAGLGSRLGLGMPKCMLEIDGTTVLSRLVTVLEKHVPSIHVVVGYREELIIDHCARFHRNVVIVRNPEFRTTNTAASMTCGARGLRKKVLFLDGDLLISEESIANFIAKAQECDVLLGVTRAKSEQAVFVQASFDQQNALSACGFTRELAQPYEWANVVAGPPDLVASADGFVYEALAPLLPLPAAMLDLCEIDTPSDLKQAESFFRTI